MGNFGTVERLQLGPVEVRLSPIKTPTEDEVAGLIKEYRHVYERVIRGRGSDEHVETRVRLAAKASTLKSFLQLLGQEEQIAKVELGQDLSK